MDYYSWEISCNPVVEGRELLYPILADLGFDSFEETEEGLMAYVPCDLFQEASVQTVKNHPWLQSLEALEIVHRKVEQENWNEVWESNVSPIEVEDKLLIRAPFHGAPKDGRMDLLIQPQMSFGTGHHETTWQMCKALMDTDLKGKALLDMGSGTGILAILSERLGATEILGIEIEAPAVDNANENAALNACSKVQFVHGNADNIPSQQYDIILANINRNVLLQDMGAYVAALKPGASLYLSGFYTSDNELLVEKAKEYKLELQNKSAKNDWSLLHFKA